MRIESTEAYRILSRPRGTEVEWLQDKAPGFGNHGRARIYPKLSTARGVVTSLLNGDNHYGRYYEYKIQRATGWEDVE